MESQCLGLAEALGLDPEIKRIELREPWRRFAPHLRLGLRNAFAGDALVPPWPHLVIATGRISVPGSLYVRRTNPRTRNVQIQNPGISPRHFDLVIAPIHDLLGGANVIHTIGALHRITPERLTSEANRLASRIGHLPRPRIGVLVGGSNAVYRFAADEAHALAAGLARHAERSGGSLLVTASRRTGGENFEILRAGLAGRNCFLWDGSTGDNPYYGILGLADILVVTADSVNMITEACATGRPVYIYGLPGGSPKFARFHEALTLRGYARFYAGSLESFISDRLDEMPRLVRAIRQIA
jgi:mitochondrial fission protein ELM1